MLLDFKMNKKTFIKEKEYSYFSYMYNGLSKPPFVSFFEFLFSAFGEATT